MKSNRWNKINIYLGINLFECRLNCLRFSFTYILVKINNNYLINAWLGQLAECTRVHPLAGPTHQWDSFGARTMMAISLLLQV